ncbi:hypothetical protein HID58_074418 [Brassica napus]|uniref:F-box domain-containing protein n=1 Tax=Brassica napus TaxID=3708 RepID=A0ABQ7YGR2_BRANA|nr:hypothetical protein HID58_074418 [Brassica napus]
MESLNLASLPPSILHQILFKVATNTMQNFEEVNVEVNVVRTFRLRCYHLGNSEAIYLRDGMMNLAFSVDDRGLVHNYPGFTCEHVDRMSHMITTRELSGHWDYDKHGMFLSLLETIVANISFACWCFKLEEKMFLVSIEG